jgi:hypothetical protein
VLDPALDFIQIPNAKTQKAFKSAVTKGKKERKAFTVLTSASPSLQIRNAKTTKEGIACLELR